MSRRSGPSCRRAACSRSTGWKARSCSTTRPRRSPIRNGIAQAMFTAWWMPFCNYGVIHGDPHLGNYSVFEEKEKPAGINLLDYGCIRIFPPSFVGGVVDLYRGLQTGDDAPRRARLRDLGLQEALTRADRHRSTSGPVHLRPAARRPDPHHRGRHQAGRVWPPRSLPGPSGAEGERPGHRARASSSSWIAPPSGSARSSCTSRRG